MKNNSKEMTQNTEEQKKMNALIHAVFRNMLVNTTDMIFIKDAKLRYMAASMPFVKMVGKEREEDIINHTDGEIFEDKLLAMRYVSDDKKLIAGGENLLNYIEPISEDNGKARYGSTSKYILADDNGNFIGILGITKDITRDYLVRQHYQQELQFLFELPEDAYAVVYIDVDSWRVISQRRKMMHGATMPACTTVEEMVTLALDSIIDKQSEAYCFYEDFTMETLQYIYKKGKSSLNFTYQRRLSDGSVRWVYSEVKFLTDVDSGHLCVMLSARDIQQKKQEEERWMTAAKTDKMTMLLNRETTMELIRQILSEENEKKHALMMVDVDNFKKLNDTLGHQEGDEFLIKLAKLLRADFGKDDIVGRIGGDEFWILIRNTESIDSVKQKAQELCEGIVKICNDYQDISLSGSIGISFYPQDGRTLEELYAKADEALYIAKRNGKSQFVISQNRNL